MTDLTVRKPDFTFPDDIPLTPDTTDKLYSAFICAATIISPHIERYLIRSMSSARQEIKKPQVLEDLLKFSQQEASHFRNHDKLNEILRDKLSSENREKLKQAEAQLQEDYRRFSNTKSLNFNLAYAEGFESATCGISLWGFRTNAMKNMDARWKGIMEWHLAEEIEHRTVAYDVYHEFKGHYLHRIIFGTYAQGHLMKFLYRFAQCFISEFEQDKVQNNVFRENFFSLMKHLLTTVTPWYSPHKLQVDGRINDILEKYA